MPPRQPELLDAGQPKFAPSTARVPLREKASEAFALFRDKWAIRSAGADFSWLFEDIAEYDELLRAHVGVGLADARVFEIGYGARPYRLVALQSLGVDASGVDAEVPVMSPSARAIVAAFRANGLERAAKSLVRSIFFDPPERAAFRRALGARGIDVRVRPERFLVSDAAALELPDDSFDLIISEDVFEHVERRSLERLTELTARWLRPEGIALVRPTVWTGITGGHLVEWNRRSLRHPPARRKSEPWEHLRRARFHANTYLNRLTRAEYRQVFARHFEILAERVKLPDLGREFLTPAVRGEVAAWPDEELFSNQVLFVLRPRRS